VPRMGDGLVVTRVDADLIEVRAGRAHGGSP